MNMEVNVERAMKQYAALIERSRSYYQRNRDKILDKRIQKYREENPTPKQRGRPRKVTASPTSPDPTSPDPASRQPI